MTLQTHGTPDLSYSQSTFRELYEALKAWDNYATANYPENMKLKRIAWELTEKASAKAEGTT